MRPPRIRGTRSSITNVTHNTGRWLQERAWEAGAAAVLAVIYIAVLVVLPKDVFWHPDEGGKFLQMVSTRWDGGIRTSLRYGAAARDPELKFYPMRCANNRVYPQVQDGTVHFLWPVWFPLATRPFYERWGATGLYFIPLVSGWLTALLSATWVRPYGRALAAGTVLLVGLATPVAYYSFAFLEHTLTTFLGVLGLWSLCRRSRTSVATAIGIVALLVAAALRVEMIVFGLAATTGWLVARYRCSSIVSATGERQWRWRREIWLVVGAAIALCAVSLPFLTPRHWVMLREVPDAIASTSHKSEFLFESLRYLLIKARGIGAAQVTPGAEVIALLSLFACFLAPFVGKRRWEGYVLLVALTLLIEVSFVVTLLSHAYVARQGLFTIAPFLAIALYCLPQAWRAKEATLLCLAVTGLTYFVGALFLLFTTRVGYSGDYLIGLSGPARYVIVLYPVWTAMSLVALQQYRTSDRPFSVRSGVTLLVLIGAALSVTYQARGIMAVNRNRETFARWAAQLPVDRPVVTSEWWLGAALAPHFIEHEMYCVTSAKRLDEWVPFAQAHGIDEFAFAIRRGVEPRTNVATGLPLSVDSDNQVDGLQLTHLRLIKAEPSP